ncbi:MAG: FtsX-like permease family protein [Acidobacteria bacterium]|nr:FtsX-like permease family protein [Acidobacteriota bacterium]
MKYVPLVWKSLWRRKVRTVFTLACIFIAFLLFGLLMTIRAAFSLGIELAGLDRLVLIHKVSLILPLPVSYQARIAAVPGVVSVTHNTWFGGIYQDPTQFFAKIAVEPERFFAIYPEYRLPPDQMKAWLADRQGAVAGRSLADRFNWKVGDRIPIQGDIWRPKGGDGATWEFNLAGIYDGEPSVDKTQFFFRYDYFDENRQFGEGLVGWYIVKVADPARSLDLARQFDDMFANSPEETKTTTEKGFVDSFAKQIGDIGTMMIAILSAVLFTILLVVGNTMAQAVRERTSELAVLKTLGFSNGAVLALVLAESLFIAVLGGGLGLALAWAIVQQGDPTNGLLPAFVLPDRDVLLGIVLMLALGMVAGAIPAVQAMRLKITDALRRN